ncbi:HesA/MoeB/ThiF family protein [Pseudoalteromonas sp. MMG010]|uniref:HesA/MoeB/ThiF family protein n=1 Tax=Pseudoalteromonas sp. MMG010 TaxID=2822685 RepID=UPI001B3A0A65|nr:HesA/MoeB/ThiF family protein [Pseudoalteromonas sp. MMG010]MBQ4834255.1 HesA/MoeB/ThiF family protein [Pseudoalteromonas sp. MMG010]
MSTLNGKEMLRYSRHLLVKEVGLEGQLKLKNAAVTVVGAGGLGSPALLYLAASGVGTLTLIDGDSVELSNLQRQILYKVNHLGQQKVSAAQKVLGSLNNQIKLISHNETLTAKNAHTLLAGADIVLDCSDNFATRYVVNQVCLANKTPLIAAAAQGKKGQLMAFDFREKSSACYQCVFPKSQHSIMQNCSNSGVISPLLGVIGAMQAQLTLNMLLHHSQGCMFVAFDALTLQQQHIKVQKDPGCSHCA